MNCLDPVVMWSSVVLFILTFAVLGLLLGFAAVYNTNQGGQMEGGLLTGQNITSNASQGNLTISPGVNEKSG